MRPALLRPNRLLPIAALWACATSGLPALAADAEAGASSPPVLASTYGAADAVDSKADEAQPESRVDIRDASTAPLRWTSSVEYSGSSYRWSMARGALDFGMRFETPAGAARPVDLGSSDVPAPVASTLPAVSLGLRRSGSVQPASTLLARSLGSSTDNYVSKLGIEWKPAEPKVNFLREGLGIRLDGNDRMTVRLRKGVLGIYMQRRF